MTALSILDLTALGLFLASWAAYSSAVRHGFMGQRGLNDAMND